MKKITYFSLICILILDFQCGISQQLVKSELLKKYSRFDVRSKYRSKAKNGIIAYKLWYKTNDIEGEPDTASGLLLVPDVKGKSFPAVLYQHGTTSGPQDCPSNLKGIKLAMGFASEGYVCSAADYLGLGEARGFHPYLHPESEAWAARDMFYAVSEFCEENDIFLNPSRFVSGYSQGGHASMALFKMLEETDYLISVSAAAPMSGPYDMSGIGIDSIILKEKNYLSLGFFPYIVIGLQQAYSDLYDSLGQVFKPIYLPPIKKFANQQISLTTLNVNLWSLMTRSIKNSFPRNLFTDEMITALENKDTSNTMIKALMASDLYDWKPNAPLRMYYCEGDKTVPYYNAIVTDSVMNALDAEDVEAISAKVNANHSQCSKYTLELAIKFFNGINVITNTTSINNSTAYYTLRSNMVMNEIWLLKQNEEATQQNITIAIIDINGEVIRRYTRSGDQYEVAIDISQLPIGNYFLQVISSVNNEVFKFVKM